MEVPNCVAMTGVEVLAEHVLLDSNVAVEFAPVPPTVPADNVEMMDAEESLVEAVLQPKHVPTEFALELRLPIVQVDNVETTEPVGAAVLVPVVNDAEQVNVNVTMTVTTETVGPLPNQKEPTQDSALKDPVGPAPLVIPALQMEDVQFYPLVM